jgi:fatty acid desaturase
MTQTSHIQQSTQWNPDSDACWTQRQIETALDYSVGDELVTWATAGLNNQGLHHAIPTISSAHFADMYQEYEDICRMHGVEPRKTENLGSATRSMLDYIFDLNKL